MLKHLLRYSLILIIGFNGCYFVAYAAKNSTTNDPSSGYSNPSNDKKASKDVRKNHALTLINHGKYEKALTFLHKLVKQEAHMNNADYWNLIGFSSRKIGKTTEAHEAYGKALAINPKHLRAIEYLGELYLQTGERGKAEEQLKKLQKLCPSGCEELDLLNKALK